MRRLLEAGAILLAPALAASVSLPADTIPSAFITLHLPESEDAATTQDLIFRLDINESEEACGYGNIAINNQTLTETRTGSFSIDDGRTIDASWDLTCVAWDGQAQEQLLNFNVESVNGQAVEEVGLTLRFQQVAPVWISDVEGSASMTRVHSAHQPKPHCDDDAELDIDAEMAELDYLRWQLTEISHEIARKEHRLAETFGMFRPQRPLMIQDCDSLKCAIRALYQKVKHTASSLYAGGEFQGHHGHGPHGRPFGGAHAKRPHGDAPHRWDHPESAHDSSRLNPHHNHTANETHPHLPPPHNRHPHEPPHGGPPRGPPHHGPPHGDHPHGPPHHGADHRPSHFGHPPPFCKCDPPHHFSGPPPHGQHMPPPPPPPPPFGEHMPPPPPPPPFREHMPPPPPPPPFGEHMPPPPPPPPPPVGEHMPPPPPPPPPPFGREHGHNGPKPHHHEEHEHKQHSSAPGRDHHEPEDFKLPTPHNSHPGGHEEPTKNAEPKSFGQAEDEAETTNADEASNAVDEQADSELRRTQALEDSHDHRPQHGPEGHDHDDEDFEDIFFGEPHGPHRPHHGHYEDFEEDFPFDHDDEPYRTHHGHHGEFEDDFHGEHDGPHHPHHGHHDDFEEDDFAFEHDGPEDFPPPPFMDHDGLEPPQGGHLDHMMDGPPPPPFGHDDPHGPHGPPSAPHRHPHGGGPILLHMASIAASIGLLAFFVRVLHQRCARRPAIELASQRRRRYSAAPWYKRMCFGPGYYQQLDDEEKEAMLRDCDSDCASVEGDNDVVGQEISSFHVAADVVGEMVMAEENRMMVAMPSHSRHSSSSTTTTSVASQIYTPSYSSQASHSTAGVTAAAAAMFPDLHHDEEEEMLPAYQEADSQAEDDDPASEIASSLMSDGYRPGCSGSYTPPAVSGSQGASDILGDTKN